MTYYNSMSNQFTGLNAVVVPGTLRDSLIILGLLARPGNRPRADRDHDRHRRLFRYGVRPVLAARLPVQSAARRHRRRRLWRIDRSADYGPLNSLGKGTINLALIRENWPDLIRLAGSLKLGHLKAAGIMRILQVKDRPTTLARALAELGRIVKTLHILRYIDGPRSAGAFSPSSTTGIPSPPRPAHPPRRARRNPKAARQEQEEQLGALGLTLNAIAHWNAIYIQAAIHQLTPEGWRSATTTSPASRR